MSTPYSEALGATLIERSIRERIVLVGVTFSGATDEDTEASLDELAALIDTAGADEVGRVMQRRDRPDPTWFIGKGKVDELRELCLAVDADTVVFDNELSPAQQYNLEKLLGRTAIDRTAVILDIFAQNAHTLEGKAQVELALLRYRLPRLRRARPPSSPSSAVASACGSAPAKRGWRSIGGGSCGGSPSWRRSSPTSPARGACSASNAPAAGSPR